MISIEEFSNLLDELAAEIPEKYYVELNGGIVLQPEEKLHPGNRNKDLYIMGEYHKGGYLGRYVNIYYGSFARVYGHIDFESLKVRLRHTLQHELTHHLESLAGQRDLEVEDALFLAAYEQRHIEKEEKA